MRNPHPWLIESEIKISKSTFVKKNLTRFCSNYKLGPEIGSGSFGSVRKCIHIATGQLRAVKLISKDNATASSDDIKKSLEILGELDHPNIVALYEYYEDMKRYYVVTEVVGTNFPKQKRHSRPSGSPRYVTDRKYEW